MRSRYWAIVLMLLVPLPCRAAEGANWPAIAVELASGQTLRGQLDPATDRERIWITFGTITTRVRRSVRWEDVAAVRQQDALLSPREVVSLAHSQRLPTPSAETVIAIPPASDQALPPAQAPSPAYPDRFTLQLHVALGNWDRDVLADGLELQIFPEWAGHQLPARATMHVELLAFYRVEQDEVPHGRGSVMRSVARWTVRLQDGSWTLGEPLRLPFQAYHPELDTNWSPYGLVHVEVVAPGYDVFYRSYDGVRIRPWAPSRDELERKGRARLLATESR